MKKLRWLIFRGGSRPEVVPILGLGTLGDRNRIPWFWFQLISNSMVKSFLLFEKTKSGPKVDLNELIIYGLVWDQFWSILFVFRLDESSSILKWTIASSTCTENLPGDHQKKKKKTFLLIAFTEANMRLLYVFSGLQKMQHPRSWNQRFIKRMPPRRTSTSVYIEGLHLKRRLKSFTYTWWTAVKISLD